MQLDVSCIQKNMTAKAASTFGSDSLGSAVGDRFIGAVGDLEEASARGGDIPTAIQL